ncbi:MAG: hypothetical protein RLZZ28_1644 [Bacteroidota bacterium]|jgi:hydrogenase/urease accessory protein HupE
MNREHSTKIWICLLAFFLPLLIYAHEMRPALLQIKQTGQHTYDVLWKIPRIGNQVLSIKPVFPAWFELQQKIPANESGGGVLFSFSANSSRDIHGMSVKISGLELSVVDVLLQVEFSNGEQYSMIIQPVKNHTNIPAGYTVFDTIKGYLFLGIKHILTGIDHLLFVLALMLITKRGRKLIVTVTAFTLAHSITLTLAALGQIHLPGPPVEAVIALSILFLALEIIAEQQGRTTLTGRQPWLVAFSFGLLHGLGFAGALASIGLPQKNVALALGFFNVGVELGQLFFIALILSIGWLLRRKKDWPLLLKKAPAYIIGSVAAFWLIDRIVGFWGR